MILNLPGVNLGDFSIKDEVILFNEYVSNHH